MSANDLLGRSGSSPDQPCDTRRGASETRTTLRRSARCVPRRVLRALPASVARRAAVAAVWLCALFATASCADLITDPESEFEAANRAVDRWVAAHPDNWLLNLVGTRPPARPSWSRPCSQNPESGFVTLRHASGATEIDLAFRCPLGRTASVQDLRAAFAYAVLESLPHAIQSRGWRFQVLTPSSSISEVVTFSSPAPGRLHVVIQTPLFAVYGHSVRPSCQPPADAPSPPGCYLQREHRIPLHLTLTVPFDPAALE